MRNEEYSALPLTMGSRQPKNPTSFVFLMPGLTNTGRWGNTLGAQDFSNDVYVDGVAVTNGSRYLGSVKTGYSNWNTTNKVDYTFSEKHRFAGLFSTGKRKQSTPYRGNTLPLPYAVTRLVEEIPTKASLKHTWVLSPTLISQLSYGYSRLYVPIRNATVDGDWGNKAGLRGFLPVRRPPPSQRSRLPPPIRSSATKSSLNLAIRYFC